MYNQNNVGRLKSNLLSLSDVIDEFGREVGNVSRSLNVVEQYYFSHLNRVRAHLEGVIQLLDRYADSPILILPISHIMRAMLTDFITAFYLFTFYNPNDKNHITFSNELKLMDRDAYRSVIEWMQSEEDMHKYNPNLSAISKENIQDRKNGFRQYFSEILDENGEEMKTSEIRSDSNSKFFNEGEDRNKPYRTLSERYKIERLKRMQYFKMLDGYVLYKYFSQFYHESKLFPIVINNEAANDNFYYLRWAFIPVYHMTDTSIRIFKKGDNAYSTRILELKHELELIGNEE